MGAYVNPIYPYKAPSDLRATPRLRKPLIVIGAGPVGLAAAVDARLQGLPVLVPRRVAFVENLFVGPAHRQRGCVPAVGLHERHEAAVRL